MPFYHLRIVKKNGKTLYAFDFSEQDVRDKLIKPINRRKPFMIKASPLEASDIEYFRIYETKKSSLVVLEKSKWKKRFEKLLVGLEGSGKKYNEKTKLVRIISNNVTQILKGPS